MAGVGPFPSITKYFGENNTYRWIYQPDGGGAWWSCIHLFNNALSKGPSAAVEG